MKPPEVLIFDIDDTMVDTVPSYRQSIIATCAHYGVTVTADDILAVKAAGDANDDWEVARMLLARGGRDVPFDEVVAVFEKIYQGEDGVSGLKAHEELLLSREALMALKARYRLAVLTGRPRRDAEEALHRYGLADLFEMVVTRDDGELKPSPVPVHTILTQLGVTYGWMIGDTPDDMKCAVDAGIDAVGVVPPGDDVAAAEAVLKGAGAATVLARVSDITGMLLP